MQVWFRFGSVALLGTTIALTTSLAADAPASATSGAGGADRLFLSFGQDAAIVSSQWWEGQATYSDTAKNIPVDAFVVRGVVAFQPFRNIEIGGQVGLGSTDSKGNLPDGTGATDLDAYAKYVFGNALEHTDFAAGALVTLPTGDDTAGLGFNAFSVQAFGSVRYRLDHALIGGHVGVRMNGDGDYLGFPIDGQISYALQGNVVFALNSALSLVGETRVETERYERQDSLAEIMAGANWRAFGRGMLRGAVGVGLTDATPDFRVIASYAYSF